jgi:hypothetical protein
MPMRMHHELAEICTTEALSIRRQLMRIRNSSRRSFVKLLAATPLLTQIVARNLYAQSASAIGRDPRQNVYTRLGSDQGLPRRPVGFTAI